MLASAGLASRREAEAIIAAGRVTVNDVVVTQPGTKADPSKDVIAVDNERIVLPETRTYAVLYKPRGFVCALKDPEGRRTIQELLPPDWPRVFHVGRLDYQTEGLLIVTNDGDFAQRVAHPRYGCEKVYIAKVSGVPTEDDMRTLRRGVVLDGQRTAPAQVELLSSTSRTGNSWLALTLIEGRCREVRRMLACVGHLVSKLKRIRIGPVDDRGLLPGGVRRLTHVEIERLRKGRGATQAQKTRGHSKRKPGGVRRTESR